MNHHTLKARVAIAILDESGNMVAAKGVVCPVGAGDHHDVTANVGRLAAQVVGLVGGQLDHMAQGHRLIILDIGEVETRHAIGDYLRAKAAELKGKTLYHPEHDLAAWADDVDPPLEVLRMRVAESAEGPSDFRERLKAEFAKLAQGAAAPPEIIGEPNDPPKAE